MDFKERLYWFRLIKTNKQACLCERVRGMFLVLFFPISEVSDSECLSWTPLAWGNEGMYWTDYGYGKSWDTVVINGWRWTCYNDGNL